MAYEVRVKKRALKGFKKVPEWVAKQFIKLTKDLANSGPEQPEWQNYSKLGKTEYHCHLGMKWVACWKHEKETIIIEVNYVGSREKAPY